MGASSVTLQLTNEIAPAATALPSNVLERQFSIHEVLLALRRHRWLIINLALIGLAIGVAVVVWVPSTYMAETSVVLDPRHPHMTDLPSLISEEQTIDMSAQVHTEAEILQSGDIARRVIENLHLLDTAEFRSNRSSASQIVTTVKYWLTWDWDSRQAFSSANGGAYDYDKLMASAIAQYKSRLNVTTNGRSFVISVTYWSHDPMLAAKILNKHVEFYLEDQVAYKREVGKQAIAWLSHEIENLQERLVATQEATQQFREQNGIVLTGDKTLLEQQLALVNEQLPKVVADRTQLEAQMAAARKAVNDGTISSQSDVLKSATIERLRDQEAQVMRRLGDLTAMFGPRHPSVIQAQSALADIRNAIFEEVRRIGVGTANDLAVAQHREDALRKQLSNLERQTLIEGRAEAKLHDLDREVGANRSLLEALLTRYKQIGAQQGAQVPDARVVAPAGIPLRPSFPLPRTVIPSILVAGIFLGAILSVAIDLAKKGVLASGELELAIGLPSLGPLPILPRQTFRRGRPEDVVIDKPRSAFAESIRHIRNSIQAAPFEMESPRIFLVTSSLANEGKTVLALSLARSFARTGKKTLLIDCDLRSPSIGRLLATPGLEFDLTTVLTNGCSIDQAVRHDPRSSLHYIPTKATELEPQDLLLSRNIREILRYAAHKYDIVILDSPPITAVSDALILAGMADATIFAVRWGSTHRDIVRTATSKLFASGAQLCGAVLTQVDIYNGVFSPREPEYYRKANSHYYTS